MSLITMLLIFLETSVVNCDVLGIFGLQGLAWTDGSKVNFTLFSGGISTYRYISCATVNAYNEKWEPKECNFPFDDNYGYVCKMHVDALTHTTAAVHASMKG